LLSVRTIGYTGEQRCGGESVSQSPLKDQAFSTFLDQNPPFELRPKWNSTFDKNLCRSMGRHRQHCHQETSESQIAIAPLGLIAVQVSETGNVAVRTRLTRWRRSDDRTRLQRTSLQTGNFTGNFAEISHSQTSVARETPELQRLFSRFPIGFIREIIAENRDLARLSGKIACAFDVRSSGSGHSWQARYGG
jgi:hypothetical protein